MSNAPHVIATVLEKSTKTLGSQIGQLEKLLAEAKDVHTAVEGAVEEVQTLENQRAALAQNLEQETRAHAADLQIRRKENESGLLQTLMEARGLAVVTNEALAQLQAAGARNAEELAAAVKAAESKGFSQASASASAKATEVAAAHSVATAKLEATVEAAAERNAFLQSQVAELQGQVKADRDARIAIAASEAGRQGVVVNTSSK